MQTMEELNQKLKERTIELQTFQIKAMEEIKKKEDYIQKLNYMLNKTMQERDEARQNLPNLLSKIQETPQATKSDSLSYNSSSIDSLFGIEISPELDSSTVDANCVANNWNLVCSSMTQCDQSYAGLICIASNKPLPEKGKLVEVVMKADPLLKTLLVAGQLPRWKNSPPVMPVQIPEY